jgi:biotin carboxyl carrier protein
VLESMKMNLDICSPWGGVVQSVHAVPGTDVAQGDAMVEVGLEG